MTTIQYSYNVDGALPSPLDFNSDEVSGAVGEVLKSCNCEVTTENIKQRKEERAAINKIAKVLKDEKARLRKKFLSPIADCVKKIDGIVANCDMIASILGTGINRIEDDARTKKRDRMWSMFLEMIDKNTSDERISTCKRWREWFDEHEEFGNVTCKEEDIKEEMDAFISSVEKDMVVLRASYREYSYTLAVFIYCRTGFNLEATLAEMGNDLLHESEGAYYTVVSMDVGMSPLQMEKLLGFLKDAHIPFHVSKSEARND